MGMRRWLAVIFVVGCRGTAPPEPDAGTLVLPPPPPQGEPGSCNHGPVCSSDQVCLRGSGGCAPPDQAYTVHLRWTIGGQPATSVTCAPAPDLLVEFSAGDAPGFGFAPVPCKAGLFTLDHVSRTIDKVSLGPAHMPTTQSAMLDPITGEATIDLSF